MMQPDTPNSGMVVRRVPPKKGGKFLRKKKRRSAWLWISMALCAVFFLYLFLCWLPWQAIWPDSPLETFQTYMIRNSRESHSFQFVQYFFPSYVRSPYDEADVQAREEQVNFVTQRDPSTIKLDEPVTEAPAPETTLPEPDTVEAETPTEAPTVDPLAPDRNAFYVLFYQLDKASTEAYLAEHPETLANGYSGIYINEAGLSKQGTSIYTTSGEQVLAIDAVNGILVLRITGETYRGVLAIAKDPSRLHLYTSPGLSTSVPDPLLSEGDGSGSVEAQGYGLTTGQLARQHNGILAITGSGFYDAEGTSTGGAMAGFCRSDGVDYGTHRPWGDKRLELRKNGWLYIMDAPTPCSDDATNAMEFQPAMIVDGERLENYVYTADNPRACVGQTDQGEILMLAIEGRLDDSPGCSVGECTSILQRFRCITAMNMDGGTSAMLWFDGEPLIRCSNQILPEGRSLPNAWVYVRVSD